MKPVHVVIITMLAAILGVGSAFLLGKDNIIEQTAEIIIKDETGLDVDLTPEIEENKK